SRRHKLDWSSIAFIATILVSCRQFEHCTGQVFNQVTFLSFPLLLHLDAVGVDICGVRVGFPGNCRSFIGVIVVVEVGGVLVDVGIAAIVHNINLCVGGGGVGDNQFGVRFLRIAVIVEFAI